MSDCDLALTADTLAPPIDKKEQFMRRKFALIATSLTMLAGLGAVPSALAQGGPGGGGGGGGGRAAKCVAVSFDPVTGVETVICTTARA